MKHCPSNEVNVFCVDQNGGNMNTYAVYDKNNEFVQNIEADTAEEAMKKCPDADHVVIIVMDKELREGRD